MSGTRGTTVTAKDYKVNGTLYINGQIISQDCSLTLPVFVVENKHDALRKREQVFVCQSLIVSEPQI